MGEYDKGWVCQGLVCPGSQGGYVNGVGMTRGWVCPVGGCVKGVRVGMFSDGCVPGGGSRGGYVQSE